MKENINKHRVVHVKIFLFESHLKKKKKRVIKIAKKFIKNCSKIWKAVKKTPIHEYVGNLGLDWLITKLLASCTPTSYPRALTPNITLQSLLSFSRVKGHLHSHLLLCIISYLFGTWDWIFFISSSSSSTHRLLLLL